MDTLEGVFEGIKYVVMPEVLESFERMNFNARNEIEYAIMVLIDESIIQGVSIESVVFSLADNDTLKIGVKLKQESHSETVSKITNEILGKYK